MIQNPYNLSLLSNRTAALLKKKEKKGISGLVHYAFQPQIIKW